MDMIIKQTIALLMLAIIVGLVAHKMKMPYTVGLVITGILLKLAHVHIDLHLTHVLIFQLILPPLLFEAAININERELRRDILPILVLAIAGVVMSAGCVALGLVYLLEWPLSASLLFGVIIAATDPVAVIAMLKDNNIKGRLRLLVESESLFNDGVAAVLFSIVILFASGTGDITAGGIAKTLFFSVGGGVAAGAVFGMGGIILAGKVSDHLVETAITTIVAYGSFMTAEHFHCSGVLATVVSGLIIGNPAAFGKKHISCLSERGESFIMEFWEFIAFLANSLIFLLIGLRVAVISFSALGLTTVFIVLIVLASRAMAVYPLCLIFCRSRWAISWKYQHILWWGGLRGALGIALCLSLPPELFMHDEIVVATFGVVVFSILVQGLTMPLLLKKSDEEKKQVPD